MVLHYNKLYERAFLIYKKIYCRNYSSKVGGVVFGFLKLHSRRGNYILLF